MTDDPRNVDQHQRPEFEQQDLRAKPIITFLVSLGVILVVCYFLVLGFYRFMDRYQEAHQPRQNPLVPPRVETAKPTKKTTNQEIKRVFPDPRLEEDERGQLNGERMTEDVQLHSYGWTDEKTGVVHIPIERAMELIAQRGLPVYSASQAASPRQRGSGAKAEKQ